jgi:hypothetical protein
MFPEAKTEQQVAGAATTSRMGAMLGTEDARNIGEGSCGLQGRPVHGRTQSLCGGEQMLTREWRALVERAAPGHGTLGRRRAEGMAGKIKRSKRLKNRGGYYKTVKKE